MSAISPPGRQQSLTEAIAAAQSAAAAEPDPEPLRDDRVVTEALTCPCGQPAGADGLCYGCRADHAGEVAGNGRRL